jgi:hypothetical protein
MTLDDDPYGLWDLDHVPMSPATLPANSRLIVQRWDEVERGPGGR